MRKRFFFFFLVILLFSASLRFYRLDAQSFWNDEGNSARIAERTVDLIVEGAAGDIHPPGYYLLLHAWRALLGQSEFALRSLSVVAGVALVLFTGLLGHRLFGAGVGLAAACMGALSPLAVYYSQEARMYALLGALSAASTWLLLLLARDWLAVPAPVGCDSKKARPARRGFSWLTFVLYVAAAAAGLYTQYAFSFVLLAHNAMFGLWWLSAARRVGNQRRWLALWAGAQAAIVILYLPWLPSALGSIANWSSAGRPYELGAALVDAWRVLVVGVTLRAEEGVALLVGAGVLLLAGLFSGRPARRITVAGLALWLLLPLTLVFAFDLYKPAWRKFLIIVLPPFHVLGARGMGIVAGRLAGWVSRVAPRVSRRVARAVLYALFIILLGAATLPSLNHLYFDPTYARDDYRQIAADISATRGKEMPSCSMRPISGRCLPTITPTGTSIQRLTAAGRT